MSSSPLVSIGMPVFNCEKTIRRALESLTAQDYANLEIIVSDNCSTDSTTDICREYADKDSRIKFSQNPENLGAVKNFEIVAEKASGEYFFWAAGDDYWKKGFTRALVNALENDPRAAVAQCAVQRVKENGDLIDVIRFVGEDDPGSLSSYSLIRRIIPYKKDIINKKFNYFLIGMFRAGIFQNLMKTYPLNEFGERPILAAIAVNHRFLFVDEILMEKTQYDKQFKERNPDDSFKKRKKPLEKRKYFAKIFKYLFASPAISSPSGAALAAQVMAATFGEIYLAMIRGKISSMMKTGSK